MRHWNPVPSSEIQKKNVARKSKNKKKKKSSRNSLAIVVSVRAIDV